jgi:hypothetical protein
MADPKPKSTQVRAGERVFDWLKDQQHLRRKATGIEPTYEELLIELLDLSEQSSRIQSVTSVAENLSSFDDEEVKIPYAPEHMPAHTILERILTNGTERQIVGIMSNLEAFDEQVSNRPPMTRKVAG